ncbi:UNVERIFIED_CONTAM: hypothetical protein GTU68_021626 [Idotea baltica]|nr:hypothetical protein [Idotea baltica]
MILEDLFEIRNSNQVGKLSDEQVDRLKYVLEQINIGVPLQYAVEVAHFYGRRFKVTKDVLIPRPETEELVYYALEAKGEGREKKLSVIDIGTGSGCIAITLKKEAPTWLVSAIDISLGALEIATENAKSLEANIEFLADDITNVKQQKISEGLWDIIISNPPYISESELGQMDQHVISHEPHLALFPENGSPKEMYAAILLYGRRALKKDGIICLELNEYMSSEIKNIAGNHGFQKTRVIKDLQGKDRILIAGQVLENTC